MSIPFHIRPCGNPRAPISDLFKLGWDTAKIAVYWGVSEAQVERSLTIERSRRLDLPNPYSEVA